MALVVDADGLWLLNNKPELVRGYERAILTPNGVELPRLCKAIGIPEDSSARDLAAALGNVTGDTAIQPRCGTWLRCRRSSQAARSIVAGHAAVGPPP